jgi:hypothetical protein
MAGTIQRLYRSDSESIPQDEMAPVTQNAARLEMCAWWRRAGSGNCDPPVTCVCTDLPRFNGRASGDQRRL